MTWAISACIKNPIRGAIARLARKRKAVTTVPYCHVYPAPEKFTEPESFKAKTDKGLLAWHTVTQQPTRTIVSYWQDKNHFDQNREWFESALGIVSLGWGGTIGDLHGNDSTWWPTSAKEALIGAAAVVGAFTVICGGAWSLAKTLEPIWTTPRTEVYFSESRMDLSEGEDTKISINARNDTQFVSVYMSASANLIDDGCDEPVLLNPSKGQWVEPEALELLTGNLHTPNLPKQNPVPKQCKLSVSVNAQTWPLGHRTSSQRDLSVEVWPRSFSWTRQLRWITQAYPNFYSVSGTLYSGMVLPNGLRGTVSIVAPKSANISFDVLPPFRVLRQYTSPPANSMSTTVMSFQSPPLGKYDAYPFQLTIRGAYALQREWIEGVKTSFSEEGGG